MAINIIDLFMERVGLSSDQDDDKGEKIGVRLMTIHSAKGLEFNNVFIVGLEEGLFPSENFGSTKKSKEEEEEERRLFYVAVTRARKRLYLSFVEMRTIFGRTDMRAPSTFLEDLSPTETVYNEMYFK
ncbi:MAG: 3'-5' exonuclease, partial [Cyanobium sp. MAG06]|nr:3'-5' exonuclease [Cyanobium sp. MAG06]